MITPNNNHEEVFRSKLIAKATYERDGKIYIVAVFDRSSYYKFFWIFQARTRRSPRKSWKFTGQYFSIYKGASNMRDTSDAFYSTMEQFCSHRYEIKSYAYKVRYLFRKKYVKTFFDRIANPLKYSIPEIPAGATFGYASPITSGRRPSKQDITAYKSAMVRYDNPKK